MYNEDMIGIRWSFSGLAVGRNWNWNLPWNRTATFMRFVCSEYENVEKEDEGAE